MSDNDFGNDRRARDVGVARALSVFSVAWGTVAALIAIAVGFASGSLSVVGFGIDSAIDAAASVALVWRFHVETRDPSRADRLEHLAERLVGGVLLVAAAGLALGALRALVGSDSVRMFPAQVALLTLSVLVLPPLALTKRNVALRLRSNALRNDALLTGAAALLALVALIAGVLATVAAIWWADALGALIIAAILAREGWASVSLGRNR